MLPDGSQVADSERPETHTLWAAVRLVSANTRSRTRNNHLALTINPRHSNHQRCLASGRQAGWFSDHSWGRHV